jgi:hypothetical protein
MDKFLEKSKAQSNGRPTGETRPRPEPQPLTGNFWRFAVLFSFGVNVILLLVLLVLVGFIFQIRNEIAQPIVGGLHQSFEEMQQASIVTAIDVQDTIQDNDTMPVVFDLPLNQATTVTTLEPVVIHGATVNLVAGGLAVSNATADIVLPAGTALPVQLNLTVPVSQTIPVALRVPVNLKVPVNIPLAQTQLNPPFARLTGIVAPYDALLNDLPASWSEAFFGR